jgi:hypothetical protein
MDLQIPIALLDLQLARDDRDTRPAGCFVVNVGASPSAHPNRLHPDLRMTVITSMEVVDWRYPTSLQGDGSDAVHKDPDVRSPSHHASRGLS